MVKQLVIVGGGTAGWLTAAYLARTLATAAPAGARITLIESAESTPIGVVEGTLPSIRRTLRHIGLDEGKFLRENSATFKQGTRFIGWRFPPGAAGRNDYFHPFQSAQIRHGGLDLLPYWLLGLTPGVALDEAATVQKRVAYASRAPKRITDADFEGPLDYAYHVDAVSFAHTMRDHAKQLGVQHIVDAVQAVELDKRGSILSLTTREHGDIKGDLYVDCSGFQGQLIKGTLGIPLKSCRSTLFCDRAVVMQVPPGRLDAPIASYTSSTAHEAGWTWDIELDACRGVGYVYSSDHCEDASAEQILHRYVGSSTGAATVRQFRFEAGYRETQWHSNCVAIGAAAGFFEPLEATGIALVEVAAILLAQLFPWNGEFEVAARQFNRIMSLRYQRVRDFLKVHYCLTRRTDTAFWRDNTRSESIPDTLQELLERWRFRPPEGLDFDPNIDSFDELSWPFVLYGMGFTSHLSARAATFSSREEARKEFADIAREAMPATALLPSHRDLVRQVYERGFCRSSAG